MKVYLVGGAVRDKIMGIPSHDKDYVVVGATVEDMLNLGFIPVGKSFPVFTKKGVDGEYALARKEVKIGHRHTDFRFIFDETVSLEDDLERRDFTCNAIACDERTGELIDYHNGIRDTENGILRHVSYHFRDDPLRVMRMCRFVAQLNFTIAPETMELARAMVLLQELAYLSSERIWGEISRALQYPYFYRSVEVAHECSVMKFVLPAVDQLWFTKINGKSRGDYITELLKKAGNDSAIVKFALLLCEIGRGETAEHLQEEKGVDLVRKACRRLKVPMDYERFAVLIWRIYPTLSQITTMSSEELMDLIEECTKRAPTHFDDFIAVCRAVFSSLSKGDPSVFRRIEERIRRIREVLDGLKASEMSDFDKLKKNSSFQEKYRAFKLNVLKEHNL